MLRETCAAREREFARNKYLKDDGKGVKIPLTLKTWLNIYDM